MRRLIALTTTVLLVVSACGGDAGDDATEVAADQPEASQAETTQPAPDAGESDDAAPEPAEDDANDGDESEGEGPSTATVTLGDQTYSFSTEGAIVAQCLTDLFGLFSIQLPRVDDTGAQANGSVQIVVLREGTDPDVVGEVNSVQVSIDDEDWVADEADMMYEQSDVLEPGMGQVDSVEIDGRTVRGTATFFRQNSLFTSEVETITGTFEATCGEERTS